MTGSVWIAIGIYLVTNLVATVWWASSVNTLLKTLNTELRDLIGEFKAMKESYVKKEEIIRENLHLNAKIDAAWKRLDKLQEKMGV